MSIKSPILTAMLCLSLVGCISLKPTDQIISRPTATSADGPVYYLPLTALGATIPIDVVEYEYLAKDIKPGEGEKYYAAEIGSEITIKRITLPDPDQRYRIESKYLSGNPFLLSTLSFGMSENGLLTTVSAQVTDETLDAVAAGVTLIRNVASGLSGIPLASPVPVVDSEPTKTVWVKSELRRVGVIDTLNTSFVFIPMPGADNLFSIDSMIPDTLNGRALTYIDSFEISVGSPMAGSGTQGEEFDSGLAPSNSEADIETDSGIYYRTPKYMEVSTRLKRDFGGDSKEIMESADYIPLMQFGVKNSLPIQSKRFTNRSTTATFNGGGGLTNYGVTSGTSAKKVLETLNTTVTDVRKFEKELAAQKENEERERLAEQKRRFEQMKELQAYYQCTQTPGSNCNELLNAFLQSFLE